MQKIRVLLAIFVLDAHDRGPKYIAAKLMQAGMEVIYISYGEIEEVAKAAIEEAVDVIGISNFIGSPRVIVADLMESLKRIGRDDILVLLGGIIPNEDIPVLQEMGVKGIFGPGTGSEEIINYILQNYQTRSLGHE